MKRKTFTLFTGSLIMATLALMTACGGQEGTSPEDVEKEVVPTTYNVLATEGYFKWTMQKPGKTFQGTVPIMGGTMVVKDNQVVSGYAMVDAHNFILDEDDFETPRAIEELRKVIRNPEVLYTDSFPEATLEITGVKELDADQYIDGVRLTHHVTGNLTIKDVTNQVQFDANVRMDEDKLNIIAPRIIIDRTQWGVDYKSKSVHDDLKDDYVEDEIHLRIRLNTVKA